jgi:hypothetical protein
MAGQSEDNSKWENALNEGLLWACIASFASLVIFLILCWLNEISGVDILFLSYLFYPARIISEYLIARQILCNENVFGFFLIGISAPWMIIGLILGMVRGYFFRPSALSERDGCLKASFYFVLAVIAGVALIFIY